jgi:surface antigen
MSQSTDFVAKARTQEGVKESPANSNQTIYGKFTKHDGQPWCGSFVMWCANEIGFKAMPNCVYTPAGVTAFQGQGRWSNHETAKPAPGDIVFFSFDGKGTEHVGIVVKDNGDGTVTTIEGNTTPDGKTGSEANGGQVCLKTRAYRSDNKRKMTVFVVGFGRPKWTA